MKTPNRPTSLIRWTSLLAASTAVGLRWSLLHEGPRPLEQVVRREDPHRRLALRLVALGRGPVERVVDERLDGAHGERSAVGDLLADRPRPIDRLAPRHDLVDETDPLGVGGGGDPPRQQ